MLPDMVIAEVFFFVVLCAEVWAWLLLTFFKTLSEILALKVLFWRKFLSFCLKNGVFMKKATVFLSLFVVKTKEWCAFLCSLFLGYVLYVRPFCKQTLFCLHFWRNFGVFGVAWGALPASYCLFCFAF